MTRNVGNCIRNGGMSNVLNKAAFSFIYHISASLTSAYVPSISRIHSTSLHMSLTCLREPIARTHPTFHQPRLLIVRVAQLPPGETNVCISSSCPKLCAKAILFAREKNAEEWGKVAGKTSWYRVRETLKITLVFFVLDTRKGYTLGMHSAFSQVYKFKARGPTNAIVMNKIACYGGCKTFCNSNFWWRSNYSAMQIVRADIVEDDSRMCPKLDMTSPHRIKRRFRYIGVCFWIIKGVWQIMMYIQCEMKTRTLIFLTLINVNVDVNVTIFHF